MSNAEQFSTTDNGLLVRAPAKLNLSLLIAGKRPDGFHNIETLMAKIDCFDEILIEPTDQEGVQLVCNGPCWAPEGQENLVCRAAQLLLDTAGIPARLRLTLTKNIPAGSGLGSASSDAAATLLGVNRFLDLNLDMARLEQLAGRLGSDVPFFLNGPIALCTGRGEKIGKIGRGFDFSALLVVPHVNVSTKRVYANYSHDQELYERLSGQIKTLIQQNRIDLVSDICANMLLPSCFELHKELAELKMVIEQFGIGPVCLSGSGSAMFCIMDNGDWEGVKAYRDILQRDYDCTSLVVHNNRW